MVNIVTDALARQMNDTAIDAGSNESEFDLAGLETVEAERVSVSRVRHAPVQMECRLCDLIHVGDGPGDANIVECSHLLIQGYESSGWERMALFCWIQAFRMLLAGWANSTIAEREIGLNCRVRNRAKMLLWCWPAFTSLRLELLCEYGTGANRP